tara:strand:- start:672 stop:2195 length:1524 start_codon:yes stop_codon:yes gene_type:complete
MRNYINKTNRKYTMKPEDQLIKQRIEKVKQIRELGINPYPYEFNQKNHAREILEKFKKLKKHQTTKTKVSVAGRIMSFRLMGKASFIHLQDETGKIQIYVSQKEVGERLYKVFKKFDMGDIIGVEGKVFTTKAGEVSVWAKKIELLCKNIRPLPDKWHGLKNIEQRYRKRHIDLIANPQVKEIFVKRAKVISLVREFLDKEGFLEVETPTLQPIHGGAAAKPFKTYINDLKRDVYLSISPELYLKRLTVGGFEKVYTICKNFRNEAVDSSHNPEFTMMECYQAYVDYHHIMKLTENMVSFIAKKVNGNTKTKFGGHSVDLKAPWRRITMKKAIIKYGKFDVEKLTDTQLKKKVKELKIRDVKMERGFMIQALFEEIVEDKLIQPTFITEYPASVCPLTKEHRKNSFWVERFEAYIGGMELANAYSELNDPIEQERRFDGQLKQKREDEDPHLMVHKIDEDFVESLSIGMPPLGGVGIGIDRLVMIIVGQSSLKEVILFPFMKSFKNS